METIKDFHRTIGALEHTYSPVSCLLCLKSRRSNSAANRCKTWLPHGISSESQTESCMTLQQHSYVLIEEYVLNCEHSLYYRLNFCFIS